MANNIQAFIAVGFLMVAGFGTVVYNAANEVGGFSSLLDEIDLQTNEQQDASSEARAQKALEFIFFGDRLSSEDGSVEVKDCISTTKIFNSFSITHDWNLSNWKSKQYSTNAAGERIVLISCIDTCVSYDAERSVVEFFGMALLLQGLDPERSILLDASLGSNRIDAALTDLQLSCPGVNLRY